MPSISRYRYFISKIVKQNCLLSKWLTDPSDKHNLIKDKAKGLIFRCSMFERCFLAYLQCISSWNYQCPGNEKYLWFGSYTCWLLFIMEILCWLIAEVLFEHFLIMLLCNGLWGVQHVPNLGIQSHQILKPWQNLTNLFFPTQICNEILRKSLNIESSFEIYCNNMKKSINFCTIFCLYVLCELPLLL